MAGMVSFKVYMSTEDEASREVRRFGVEADVVTNFVYLREKLQTIFPSLRGKHFTVSWKDSDGDDVIISSDEELQIALDETASSDIRKLHVVLHSEYSSSERNPTSQTNGSGLIHLGVTCHGCDKQIQGFRYKCVQCSDYDLCVDCEGRGMHSEHCMIRLSLPLQWKSHYGRRLATQVNKFVKKAQSHTAKEEEPKQCPYKSDKRHGKTRHFNDDSSWIDTFATYLDEWANLPGECPMKETAKEAKKNDVPSSSTEAKTTPRGGEKSPAEHIKHISDVGANLTETFLSRLLDPLLMTIQASNGIPTASTSAASSAAAAATATAAASACTSGSSETDMEASSQSPNEPSASPKFPGEGKKLRGAAAASSVVPPAQPTADKVSTEKVTFENEGWTLLNKSDSPTPSVISPVSSSTGAVPKQAQPTAPIEGSSTSIYPKLPEAPQKKPDEVPVIYHPNPTIQKSVESMIQMGFSNEGNWLTNLLVSKSGDIAAALDALSPVRR